MKTITYNDKEYTINEEALSGISDEWKAILYKANHDRRKYSSRGGWQHNAHGGIPTTCTKR